MIAFLSYHLRQLFTVRHFAVLAVYLSFAWFMSAPASMSQTIYNSRALNAQYEMILLSFVFMNFLLFMTANFRTEFSKGRKGWLLTKLTAGELTGAFVISYSIYWTIGFALPSYFVAFCEQMYYAPQCVRIIVFLEKFLCSVAGYPLLLIAGSLVLFSILQNEFTFLLLSALCCAGFHAVGVVSHGMLFNYFWLYDMIESGSAVSENVLMLGAVAVSNMAAWTLIRALGKRIRDVTFSERLNNGWLVRLSRALKADLSMHHVKMLGLANAKVLYFFTFLGLCLVIALRRMGSGDFTILAHLYIGAFLPCLFAFNQYRIVRIDIDAGMVHNNFLRKMPYEKIVLNRWMVMLLPQLFMISTYFLILCLVDTGYSAMFYLYIILLSILFSLINLNSALITKTGMTANLILLFIIYFQLRDDVQSVVSSHAVLQRINIFSSFFSNSIFLTHWLIVLSLIALMLLILVKKLKTLQYDSF